MTSQPAKNGFEFNNPTIISLLYLGSFVTGVSGLVGIVLAYIWQGEENEAWAASHYTYMIRTFWIGLAGSVISILLTFVFIGIFTMLAVGIWFGVRSVLCLVRAQRREPMPDPQTLLL